MSSTCVLGLGYVGLPLAVALAAAGREVVGYDVRPERVAALQAGRSGIEDVSDAEVAGSGIRFTGEPPAECTAYVICVPTPLTDGTPDLSAVEAAARSVATVLAPGDLVVLESTTYPGTTEELLLPLLLDGSGLGADDVLVAYSPERIDPGNPVFGITNTPKVVGATTPQALEAACALYSGVTDTVVPVAGTREAEMAKLLENTFRHVNIALVNEMAVFCRELGIDLHEVIAAAATKPFGFMPFSPGPGVGGHCIPVDPSYLSWRVRQLGFSFRFVELAQEINARMPSYVVTRLTDLLNDAGLALSRAQVLCLGVAYKPGVADCRESPAVEVLRRLQAKGASVRYSDPHVPVLDELVSVPLTAGAVRAFDAVVVLTPHRELDLDLVAREAQLVLDTRAALPVSERVHRL
jgi:nucleotide sugar dehydrogenase